MYKIIRFLPDFDDGVMRNIIVVIADRTVSSLALVTQTYYTRIILHLDNYRVPRCLKWLEHKTRNFR